MIKIKENFIIKKRLLFQSIAEFFGWVVMAYACGFAIPNIFLFFVHNYVLAVSTFLSLICSFVLGLVTKKQKEWNYLGWLALLISLFVLLFSLPNGIQLIFLILIVAIITLSSYFGFSYQKKLNQKHYIFGLILLIVFVFHAFLLSKPRVFGLDVKGDELSSYYAKIINEAAVMDPMEFIKLDSGKRAAIKIYNLSPLISQDELNNVVKNNPVPLIDVQKSLVTNAPKLDNVYSDILNVYLYSFINLTKK